MISSCLVRAELTADGLHVIAMAEGDLDTAATALRNLTNAWSHTEPRGCLRTEVSWPLVVQLAVTFGPKRPMYSEHPKAGPFVGLEMGPRLLSWTAGQAQRRAGFPELISETREGAPPLRDYQVGGARLIASTGRAFLFDDPGTGKSAVTLVGLSELAATGRLTGKVLVVCPTSVVDSWVKEAARWTHFRPIAYRGESKKRKSLVRQGDLIVASYGVITRDAPFFLHEVRPQALVVDECHLVKDQDALRSRAVRSLAPESEFFVALSGTPITHNTADLWPALYSLDPVGWPSRERYIRRFLSEDGNLHEIADPEFRRCLRGQQRRVAKADVLDQLPPKVYSTRYVELPPKAREIYDAMEADLKAEVEGGEITAMGALAQLVRLNQMASATADITTESTVDQDGNPKIEVHVHLKAPSWKIDALMEVLEERAGKQTLVFAPSRQLITLAGKKARAAGYKVGYVIGGQKAEERTAQVDAFQAGELDVMLATTGAGGVGLTLTAADAVVFVQRPWSFVEASQAEDRAHRIGSEIHTSVDIIDIVAKDTVDEKVRFVLKDKSGALADLLQDKRIALECLGGLK